MGQWPVNHRHDVMTRLSFQRLHRRKSSARSCLSPATPSPPCTPVARFLLRESIRWLQESGGLHVKILQKIMARYTFDRERMALRSLRFILPLFALPFSLFDLSVPAVALFPSPRSSFVPPVCILFPTNAVDSSDPANYHARGVHPSNCAPSSIGVRAPRGNW